MTAARSAPTGLGERPKLAHVALRCLWGLAAGLPILALSAELFLVLQQRTAQRAALPFERRSGNIFRAEGVHEATARSLWAESWSKYRPGAHVERILGGERYVVTINSHGFRTWEFAQTKPPGTVRVICIGGSTTVQGRTNDQTYPAILERRLRETHPSLAIEVLNLGVSGVSSDHWLNKSEELLSYGPDVLVEYDGINDIMWHALPHYAQLHPWRRLLTKSRLFQWLFPINPPELDSDLSRIVDDETLFAELCQRHGLHHIAGSFAAPSYDTAPPDEQAFLDINVREWTVNREVWPLARYEDYARILARYNTLFEQAAGSGRFEGVMLHRALTDPALYLDICHMNQEGIARLADSFFPTVARAVERAAGRDRRR